MWVLFAILSAQIITVIYAVVLLNFATAVRNSGRLANSAPLARQLASGALAMFSIGGALVIGLGFLSDHADAKGWGVETIAFPAFWGGINAILALAAALFLLQASKAVRGSTEDQTYRAGVAARLRVTAWLIILAPVETLLLPFVTSYFWGGVLVTVVGISITLILAARRKADQSAVLWALAIATERNLSLPDELDAVAAGLSRSHRRRTRELAEVLRGGTPLTVALEQVPRVIPRFALLAAHVGEENGTLPAALRDAAVQQTRSAESTGGAVSSPVLVIAYLLLLPLFGALILGGLLYWVVPKYKKIFAGFQMELPDFTQTLLDVSGYFVGNSAILFPLLLPAAVVFCVAVAHLRGWGEYNPPLFGRLLRRLDVPNLLRNFAQTVAAGRNLQEPLEVMSVRHPRKAVRAALTGALQTVRKGDDCWHALKDAGLLTPNETAVLRSAQRVGNVPWALCELADGLERRFLYRWRAALEIAQPAVVIVFGLMCAAIYFAFFLPLLKLIGGLA